MRTVECRKCGRLSSLPWLSWRKAPAGQSVNLVSLGAVLGSHLNIRHFKLDFLNPAGFAFLIRRILCATAE